MIDDQRDNHNEVEDVGVPESDEDPAGGVRIPLRRREIVRSHALAGIVLGMSALGDLLNYPPPTSN